MKGPFFRGVYGVSRVSIFQSRFSYSGGRGLWLNLSTSLTFWYNEDKDELRGKFTKFEFNLKTGKSSRTVLIEPGYSTEFPTINVNYTGYKSRYCYMSFSSKVVPKEQEGQDNMQFVGFIKFDLETEKIEFLDLVVSVVPGSSSSRFECVPKVGLRGRSLGLRSAHPKSVHESWPIVQLGRFAALSSSAHAFWTAATAFLGHLRSQGWPPDVISSFVDFACRSFPRPQSLRSPMVPCNDVWWVVPFHPLAMKPLRFAFARANAVPVSTLLDVAFAPVRPPRVRMSSRLTQKALGASFVDWREC